MNRYKVLITLLILSCVKVEAQESDTLMISIEDAVTLTLENNFDIKVSSGNADIAGNNVSLGNADYLPTVSANASYNYSVEDTRTEFASPQQPTIDATGATTESTNASLDLTYNIFSGGSRNYTFQQLKALDYQGQLQLRQTMEQAVLNAIVQFLDAANQKQSLELSQKAVEISNDRYKRAQENYKFGVFGKLELLNAEVDLRNDSTTLYQSKLAYEKAGTALINSMGLDPMQNYDVDTEFDYSSTSTIGELIDEALSSNAGYLINRNNVTTTELNLKLTKSRWFPRLDLSAAYSYSSQAFDANFITSSRNNGLNAGISLSYDIFTGSERKREQENTRVRLDNQQLTVRRTENQLKADIVNTYNDLETNLDLIELTRRNIDAAEVNYNRSVEAFSAGQITGIQLREAQLNLLNALNQLEIQRIQAKVAEVNLKFYSGTLVKAQD